MNGTKRISGVCSECGGSIEFRADLIGTTTACPRCGKQTELMLATPAEEHGLPRKVVAWTLATVVVLVVGLVVTIVGLKHFEKLAEQRRQQSAASQGADAAAVTRGFEVSAVSLQKGPGGNEMTIVTTVVNATKQSRSQVRAEFYLLDAAGKTVTVAHAIRPVLDAGQKWEIKLSVEGATSAVSAKLGSLRAGS